VRCADTRALPGAVRRSYGQENRGGWHNRRLQERRAVAGLLAAGYSRGYAAARYGELAVNPAGVAAALDALARALSEPGPAAPAPPPAVHVTLPWSALLWRRDLVPDETLLTVEQAAEALGMPKSGIYRRTSRWRREHDESCTPLPHVRVEGQLRFRVGELRRWLAEREQTVVPGRTVPLVVGRGR